MSGETRRLGLAGVAWVKEYREKTGCSLRDAAAAFHAQNPMPPSEVERLRTVNAALYEALEGLIRISDDDGLSRVSLREGIEIMQRARAALALARGETAPKEDDHG